MPDKSTPRPWNLGRTVDTISIRADGHGRIAFVYITGPNADRNEQQKANAKFIVRAVNHFDELVAAAKRCENFLINHQRSFGIEEGSVDELECTKMTTAILAKVKEAGHG